jgi:L-ascorbate metabolism protein UlaG (beta-lactamase superfamily)
MDVTYLGHSTFLISSGGHQVLFDPFISGNPLSTLSPEKVNCTHMLISHGHSDHVLDAVSIAKRTGCEVYAAYEVVSWLEGQGVGNTHGMNHGGTFNTDFGWLKFVNAVHSSTMPDGNPGGNPGGFVLNIEGKELYYAGDTSLTMDMELLGRYNQITLAFLPIGDVYTMGYEDAAIASELIQCDKIIGMHYDTYTPLRIDHEKAKKAFADKGKELILMPIGEKTTF